MLMLAAVAFARPAPASPPRFVDYLYIEANEGGSSGGHVALRFDDETYHFQHESPGLLRLHRDDSADFRHRYGALENRTIHESRIAVPAETYRRLRDRFSERYLREQKLFTYGDALHDDETLLTLLRARRAAAAGGRTVALRGAGYFFPAAETAGSSDVLRTLRDRIEGTYGGGIVRRRTARVRELLRRLAPTPDPDAVSVAANGYPILPRTYSERYRDLATELAALDALARALPLRADARRVPQDEVSLLTEGERRSLAAFAERLADSLVRLVGTDRPDVLSASVRTGRLVLLDVFPPESLVVPSPRDRHLDALRGLQREARADFSRIRLRLAGDFAEADLAALEAAGNRVAELDAALAQDADLRVAAAPLVPSREGPWTDLADPAVDDATLARAVTIAAATRRRFVRAMRDGFGYNLVTHNCVSELFRTVDGAGVDLGGRVGSAWSLAFVPFVAARAVDRTWHVVERTTYPSYRRARLEGVVGRDGWRARARESNVLTSTIYEWNDEDSAFLFFTDDLVAPRPLFGAVNVAFGVGAGLAGVALLPLDGGHLLSTGLRGVAYSLPELAFVNLRKGSFDYVPRS
jgi:hypothetical protein